MNDSALVILSGGQDSTTCLYMAKRRFETVHAITFDYGQRHSVEIDCALQIGKMAKVKTHSIIDIESLINSESPLTSQNELDRYENYDDMTNKVGDNIEKTFVALRNPMFILIAASKAIQLKCQYLVTGICQEDNANYPDCREEFRESIEYMINLALGNDCTDFQVLAPLMYSDKAQTVLIAHSMPECWEALAFTHTSYDGKYPPTDNNHSNILRAKGFEKAGYPDPLVVRAYKEKLMDLPKTSNYDSVRDN